MEDLAASKQAHARPPRAGAPCHDSRHAVHLVQASQQGVSLPICQYSFISCRIPLPKNLGYDPWIRLLIQVPDTGPPPRAVAVMIHISVKVGDEKRVAMAIFFWRNRHSGRG